MLSFLIALHLFIWLFAIVGGIFGKSIIRFNVLILLPLIYVFQMIPIHLIILKKIELILKNNYHKNIPCKIPFEFDKCFEDELIDKISKELQVPKEEVRLARNYMKCKEYDYIIPYYIDMYKSKFKQSFMNPFSAQGFIIIGYIINAYLYWLYS